MPGPLHDFLQQDHARLDRLLDEATRETPIAMPTYEAFREGLLRHIGMEEKILLPAAKRLRGGEALPLAHQLKLDHGALAALLVPTPTPELVAQLRAVLAAHNPLEEGPRGLYAECEALAGAEAAELVERMKAAPVVPLAPHRDEERSFRAIAMLLRAAGR